MSFIIAWNLRKSAGASQPAKYFSGALKAKGAMGNLRETKGWSLSNNNYALLSRKSPISPKKAAIGGVRWLTA